MSKKDIRVDNYIKNANDFAKPILNHLRKLIHQTCTNVLETIKWGFPHFEYNGILCSFASFKSHCSFYFWKVNLINDTHKILNLVGKTSMGCFGKLEKLSDLPKNEIIVAYIKQAMKLNENGVKPISDSNKNKKEKKELEIPKYFLDTINKNKIAFKTFENFSYSHKKEYVEWIVEAKTEITKEKRMKTAIEWIAEGKQRNWKYLKK